MSNTWRSVIPIQGEKRVPRISRVEYIWNTKRDEVFAEIAKLLGCDHADAYTPGWFPKRGVAIANIYKRLDNSEKTELDRQLDMTKQQGYPVDVQRR